MAEDASALRSCRREIPTAYVKCVPRTPNPSGVCQRGERFALGREAQDTTGVPGGA